jgi:hypothetical protein
VQSALRRGILDAAQKLLGTRQLALGPIGVARIDGVQDEIEQGEAEQRHVLELLGLVEHVLQGVDRRAGRCS